MEGQVLGNRYELLEKIGGGGMALVYKARCRLLNRFVAVKILRTEFNGDDEFIRRFRIEAQSAASLSHPNIVSIYDVGCDGNLHYIVMEYVDGITLKEYIKKMGILPWKEAVNIAIQICSAIEHAHRNHIVHRDIKPHNIILTSQGVAKVTDFGIARAVSTSTLTLVGNTIGSVHYFSPEQARGGYTDEKSDLYSLGITLFEMVTGKVPFEGETPVAIALKHIQEKPRAPIDVNDKVPTALNGIILKAIQKEQGVRYANASEMLEDLYMSMKDPGNVISGTIIPGELNAATRRMPSIADKDLEGDFEGGEDEMGGKRKKKKEDRLTFWMAIVTSMVLIGLLTFVGFTYVAPLFFPTEAANFIVPQLTGMKLDDAKLKINDNRVSLKVEKEVFDDKVPKDVIISQDKAANTTLKPPVTISVIVSKGQDLVEVPNVINTDYRMAELKIKNENLVPQKVDQFSEKPEGFVVKTDPVGGQKLKPGENVILYVSKGPEIKKVEVPDLTGRTMDEVRRMLSDASLTQGQPFEEESDKPAGTVIRQSIPPKTMVNEKTPVDVTLSKKKIEAKEGIITFTLYLGNYVPKNDSVRVRVEVYTHDTQKTAVQFDQMVKKTDFPKMIPILGKGKVTITVYYDNVKQPDQQTYTFGG